MGRKIEISLLAVSIVAFIVTAISGVWYYNERFNSDPRKLSAAEAFNAVHAHADDLYRNPADPVLGNPNGDVTLVEFFDYQCTYCKKVHPVVQKLLRTDGNIRYVAKEHPILGPVSTLAAQAALAARNQDGYAVFSDALMSARKLDENKIFDIARKVGLNPIRLLDDIDAQEEAINAQIEATLKLGQNLGLQGTPAFVVGDVIIPGATSREGLEKLIARARALNRAEP